jgi:general secretion pathway protein H
VRAGFTLVELLLVLALIALTAGLVSLSLRDPEGTRLEHDALRLSALLEAARAEARATGVAVRFEMRAGAQDGEAPFRFVGLLQRQGEREHWLTPEVQGEIVGASALALGPEPIIAPQRIVLRLGQHQLVLATDGLAPFAPVDDATAEAVR